MNIRKVFSGIRDLNVKGSGRLSFFLARVFLGKPKKALKVRTIYDFKLNIDPVTDSGVERSIYYYGTYEKGTLAMINSILCEGDVFVDIGANIGLMSILASRKVGQYGKVFSFEPNPNTNNILQSNIALNGCKNIHVEEFALSHETKKSKIYDRWDVNRGGASLIKPEHPTDSYEIEEIQFSDYFSPKQILKLVKIDVEGYELNVLMGARTFILESPTPPSLIVEFSSARNNTFGPDTSPLLAFLHELKVYRFFKASAGKEKISKLIEITNKNDLPNHDNVFCFTVEHLNQLPKGLF